jgi:hypothetical protein
MTESVGTICKLDNNIAYIVAAADPYLIERQRIKSCTVRFDDGRHISAEQRKKIYATIADIAEYTGNAPEYEKELQKFFYIEKSGGDYFSLSSCCVTVATAFISHLIDFCFENNIGTRDTLLNRAEDISRYLYSCLANRKCAVCNRKAEIHHCEGSRVGMGFNRRKINNIGRYAIALCRKCHNEAHNEAEAEFLDRHHIYGIKLDKYLCDKLGL